MVAERVQANPADVQSTVPITPEKLAPNPDDIQVFTVAEGELVQASDDFDPATGLGFATLFSHDADPSVAKWLSKHFANKMRGEELYRSRPDANRAIDAALDEADPAGQESGAIMVSWADERGEAYISAATFGDAVICVANEYSGQFTVIAGGRQASKEQAAEYDAARMTAASELLFQLGADHRIALGGLEAEEITQLDTLLANRFAEFCYDLADLRHELEQLNGTPQVSGRLDGLLSVEQADWLSDVRERLDERLVEIEENFPATITRSVYRVVDGDTIIATTTASGTNGLSDGDLELATLRSSSAQEVSQILADILKRNTAGGSYAVMVTHFPIPEAPRLQFAPDQVVATTDPGETVQMQTPSPEATRVQEDNARIEARLRYAQRAAGDEPTAAQTAALDRIRALLE